MCYNLFFAVAADCKQFLSLTLLGLIQQTV